MEKFFTRKQKAAAIICLCLSASVGITTFGATEHYNDASATADNAAWTAWKEAWEDIADDYEYPSVTVGATERQLNFAWYSHTADLPKVRFAKSKHGLSYSTAVEGTHEITTIPYSDALKEKLGLADSDSEHFYYANKVSISGLEENTTYYYQIYQNGKWGEIKTYHTKDFNRYSVLYIADPQIGACKGQANSDAPDTKLSGLIAARNDAYNWNDILSETLTKNKNISFIISAGDQVNTAKNEYEYAGFLYPEVLSSIPLSTAIGNHDSSSYNYSWHFNNPNSFNLSDDTLLDYTIGHTSAGSDYYYTYGNVLYIVIDTNNLNTATHKNVIAKALSENPDIKWKVVIFHQDIYGSGYDHSDSDGMVLRTSLTPIMDEYDIDVVLQGHDHTYSRTYQLSSDGKEHTRYDRSPNSVNNWSSDEQYQTQNLCYNLCSTAEDGNVLVNPKGTVYFEQNSATGSKFYNLIENQQNFIAERSQTWTPTYSIIDVTETSLTITTYDATTNNILANSSPYTIIKENRNIEYADVTYDNIATYTGSAIQPAVSVSLNGTVLSSGTDYTVTYANNISAGTASITITGTGNYTGTLNKSFTISKTPIVNRNIKLACSSYKYNGNAKKPEVRITGLKANTDFTVTYSSNINAGTAKVTVKGIGNYTGTIVKTFMIHKYSIASKNIKLSASGYTYDGTCHHPNVSISGLTPDKDYTVSYRNSKEPGTAIVTISGKGNYTGTVTKTFTIRLENLKPALTAGTKSLTVNWNKVKGATGYEIYTSTSQNGFYTLSKTVEGATKTTLTSLISGKRYYVKVRAYRIVNGVKIYGSMSIIKYKTVK